MDDDLKEDLAKVRRFRTQTEWMPLVLGGALYAGFWLYGIDLTQGEEVVVAVVSIVGLFVYREVREARAEFQHYVALMQQGRQPRL